MPQIHSKHQVKSGKSPPFLFYFFCKKVTCLSSGFDALAVRPVISKQWSFPIMLFPGIVLHLCSEVSYLRWQPVSLNQRLSHCSPVSWGFCMDGVWVHVVLCFLSIVEVYSCLFCRRSHKSRWHSADFHLSSKPVSVPGQLCSDHLFEKVTNNQFIIQVCTQVGPSRKQVINESMIEIEILNRGVL